MSAIRSSVCAALFAPPRRRNAIWAGCPPPPRRVRQSDVDADDSADPERLCDAGQSGDQRDLLKRAGLAAKLYLEGAELQALYPLSVITDGMVLNLTVISYAGKLCFAVTGCPTGQPGMENFGALLKDSFRELRAAVHTTK